MKYVIHGSGVNTKLANSSADVFVNGAIQRCTDDNVTNAIITSGLLQSDAQLLALRPMVGQSKENSFKLRKSKFKALEQKNIQNLTIIKSPVKLNWDRLKELNVLNVHVIKTSRLYRIIIFNFWYHLLVRRKIKLLLAYGIGALCIKTPKSKLRPSTGISAGILLYNLSKIVPDFTGIGNSNNAYYGSLDQSVEFNMYHSEIDHLFLEIFDEIR